jgi:cbb3-type cytochrome oxidase subunit 3
MSKGTMIILVVIGCILLAAANVATWATLDVFNADRFGEHVAKGLQSDASVEALAGPIVDRLMVNYPDFPKLLQGPAEEAVAWSLQRPAFTAVFKETAAIANKVMTTSAEDVVGIDLGGVIDNVGSTVVGVISALDAEAGANAQTALDTVEQGERLAIYESGRFPQLRTLSNLAPWLALLAWLVVIVIFVMVYKRAADQYEALKYSSVGIMITAVLTALLFIPVVQGVAQNNIVDPIMQIVVGEVVSSLIMGFAVLSLLIFFVGLVLFVINHSKGKKDDQAQTSAQDDQAQTSAQDDQAQAGAAT